MPLYRANIAIIKLQVTIYFMLQKYYLMMNADHSKLHYHALGYQRHACQSSELS
jgi:hypothetical protein